MEDQNQTNTCSCGECESCKANGGDKCCADGSCGNCGDKKAESTEGGSEGGE